MPGSERWLFFNGICSQTPVCLIKSTGRHYLFIIPSVSNARSFNLYGYVAGHQSYYLG
jgi:hypothetical protein